MGAFKEKIDHVNKYIREKLEVTYKMGKKVLLKDLFSALQETMLSEANFSPLLNHPTDQGDNAEKNWIEWFTKYLPKRYKAAKATVIDSHGNTSDQIDLVLYDAQYSYLAFNENGILYVPAESIYAIFEIKQEINKTYMECAGKKAASVRKLHRTSASIPHAGGVYPPKPLHRILAGILTTRNGWNSSFGKPFRKCISEFPVDQRIDCGCVLSDGGFFYDYKSDLLCTSGKEESLIYFFLQLLIQLQRIATVPAIDLGEYIKVLSVQKGSIIDE